MYKIVHEWFLHFYSPYSLYKTRNSAKVDMCTESVTCEREMDTLKHLLIP